MQGECVFYLCGSILVCGVYVQNSAIEFIKLDAPEKTIKIIRSNNQRHASGYCLILNQ